MRPTEEYKLQRYLDVKLEKGIGFIYGGATTDTEINNSILDNWLKVISNNISQLVIYSIFHVEVDSK